MQKKGPPVLYVGIFATDPSAASKTVRAVCKDALLETLKHILPHNYLAEGEHLPHYGDPHPLQKELTEAEKALVEKDFANLEAFSSPKDNYHITSLFLGKHKEKLNKKDRQLIQEWKHGVKELIKVDFIVYIPNYLISGYASETGKVQVSNSHPHMTLLLKEKASAVESNAVLQLLFQKAPEIFKERRKKVTALAIEYGNVSKTIFVIDMPFEIEGVTGDNCTCGKK